MSQKPPNPAHQADTAADRGRCMWSGCCCYYTACDCNNILLLSKGASDCLCLRSSCCCAVNTPHKGFGCTTDKNRGEICKLGLFCCDYALVIPTKLCANASQCLCFYTVSSCPCSPEYVPTCVCAGCFGWQCAPKCGCCAAPPPCPALDKVLRDEHLAPLTQTMEDREVPQPTPAPETAVAVAVPVAAGAAAVTTSSKKKKKDKGDDNNDNAPPSPGEKKKKKKKKKDVGEEGGAADDGQKKKKKKKKPKAEVY